MTSLSLAQEAETLKADSGEDAASSNESISLEDKVEALASEVERLKIGADVLPPMTNGKFGLAPAASKVYLVKQGVSIGGYGEAFYRQFSKGRDALADSLRLITYVGYKFSPNWVFNSEIEFEHGSTSNTGSVSVEFAYIDYLWRDAFNVRAGLVLMPMGFINEIHEPTTFHGMDRPKTERVVIPSTWRELGVGVFGQTDTLSYRAYLVTGLDAVGGSTSAAAGFDASGIRSGRQNGSTAVANDMAGVARVDYIGTEGLLAGVSAYAGQSGQDNVVGGNTIAAWLLMGEAHVDYRIVGLEFRGLVAYNKLYDADQLNAAKGFVGTGIAGDMLGGYAQLGYNALDLLDTPQQLIPFFRYEHVDTQLNLPAGYVKDRSREENIYTVGLSYRPITQIVAKVDYQWIRNETGTSADQFTLGMGYMF